MSAIEGVLQIIRPSAQFKTLECDVITSITEQISASITRVPIVTFKADQAFAFDAGTTSSISFTIVRTQHPEASVERDDEEDDSRMWTNAKFERELTDYIDRWQAETDGCKIVYTPVAYEQNKGQSLIAENVYFSSLSIKADRGKADTIYITLGADVGTMTAKVKPIVPQDAPAKGYGDKIYEENALVTMTSSDGLVHYVLYYGLQTEWNCVSSYSVKCGPESPFPVLTLKLSKKSFTAIAPKLSEDVIPGKNRIFINGIGGGEYIVTKTSTSGQYYKITAYSIYEQYRASPIGTALTFGTKPEMRYKTPMDIILRILTDAESYGSAENRIYFPLSDVIYCYKKESNNDPQWNTYESEFSSTTDAWYVLNVCALRLGCKIWFAGNKAYIVDTSVSSIDSSVVTSADFAFQYKEKLYVNMDLYEPEDQSENGSNGELVKFAKSVCDETVLGDEGSDVLKNYTVVQYNHNNYTSIGSSEQYTTSLVLESRKKFGLRREEYSIAEVIAEADAIQIADKTNNRYCDSEQSIGFKLAETHYDDEETHTRKYWQPYFSQLARVGTIYDYSKDLAISNKANFSYTGNAPLPNKLTLSTVEYFYPEGYAEYWFGIICPVDLTQNTSVINSIIYR